MMFEGLPLQMPFLITSPNANSVVALLNICELSDSDVKMLSFLSTTKSSSYIFLPGYLLQYSSNTTVRPMVTGILMRIVSSDTNIVNIGSEGGGLIVQVKSVSLQSH